MIGVSERHDVRERCPLCGTPWTLEGGQVHLMGGLYCVRRQLTQAKKRLQQALVCEARLRRVVEAALDILSREDIGDDAKVEGVRSILKGGDGEWPTRESERARLVGEVGECCRGADPMCAAGCLVEAALRQRLVDNEIERLRKEREVLAEALKHIFTCDDCECASCPQGTGLAYRAYRALGGAQRAGAGARGSDGDGGGVDGGSIRRA